MRKRINKFLEKYLLFIIIGVIITYIIYDEVTMEEPEVTNPNILCWTTQDC